MSCLSLILLNSELSRIVHYATHIARATNFGDAELTYLRHELRTQAEGEGDKHAAWGILYLLSWCVYTIFCLVRLKIQHSQLGSGSESGSFGPLGNSRYITHLGRKKIGQTISGVNCGTHAMWAGQLYSRGAYTIFHHTETENDTFPFLRQAEMWYFRPGVRRNDFFIILWPKVSLSLPAQKRECGIFIPGMVNLGRKELGQSISRVNCGKREMWAGQLYSRGAYTIFHHITFAVFEPGVKVALSARVWWKKFSLL